MLTLHFLNVGHGDCTFVDLPSGRLMMIDINNSKSLPDQDVDALAEHEGISIAKFASKTFWQSESREQYYKSLLVDPHDYYCEHFNGRSIFRYIQTHPDMDHMSGLHRFFWQEEAALMNFWDVAHAKDFEERDFDGSHYSWQDWLTYKFLRRGKGPSDGSHKVMNNTRNASGQYWSDDDIKVLSPSDELISACNASEEYNDCSYVLKINHAGRSVMLPGDAEGPAWKSIIDELGTDALACDVLKAAHHGRESGYDEDAVAAMSPDLVICSVGKKPSTDASYEYASHGAKVLSTRYHGTLKVTIEDNGEILVTDHEDDEVAKLDRLY